jgi:hypothetical protein
VKVKKLNSSNEVLISINKYKIKWDEKSASKPQFRVKQLLKPYWKNCIVLEEFRIPGSKLRVDFLNCNKRLAVEFNGPQHDNFNKHFHQNCLGFRNSLTRDFQKLGWLEKNEIQLLELVEEDLDKFSPLYILDKYSINIL